MTDRETTVEELKQLVKRFCDERDWEQYHNPKDLAIGMATESSELLDIFRFRDPEEVMSDPARLEHVKQELSDVFYFVLRFAQTNGIDLSEELPRKIALNAEKYPVEPSKGRNLKYDELRPSRSWAQAIYGHHPDAVLVSADISVGYQHHHE